MQLRNHIVSRLLNDPPFLSDIVGTLLPLETQNMLRGATSDEEMQRLGVLRELLSASGQKA